MAKRNEARWEHWRSVLAEQRASGVSVAEFCRRRSISTPSFYNWRRRLEAEEHVVSPFISVTLPTAHVASQSLELILSNGITLRIPAECDEAVVTRVLRSAASLESGDA